MIIEHTINRRPTVKDTTFGEWLIDGAHECFTLEDAIREQPGVPVEQWKIKARTAIPAGRYRLTLETSKRFGPDTITVNDVEGFDAIRVHGGNTAADTEGCPIVGDQTDEAARTISGATTRGALIRLKAKIKGAIADGHQCWVTVNNT